MTNTIEEIINKMNEMTEYHPQFNAEFQCCHEYTSDSAEVYSASIRKEAFEKMLLDLSEEDWGVHINSAINTGGRIIFSAMRIVKIVHIRTVCGRSVKDVFGIRYSNTSLKWELVDSQSKVIRV